MFVINKEKLKKNTKISYFQKKSYLSFVHSKCGHEYKKYAKKKINCDIKGYWFN